MFFKMRRVFLKAPWFLQCAWNFCVFGKRQKFLVQDSLGIKDLASWSLWKLFFISNANHFKTIRCSVKPKDGTDVLKWFIPCPHYERYVSTEKSKSLRTSNRKQRETPRPAGSMKVFMELPVKQWGLHGICICIYIYIKPNPKQSMGMIYLPTLYHKD